MKEEVQETMQVQVQEKEEEQEKDEERLVDITT